MAAYRATSHESTGFTPNRLFLGRENRMPLDLVMGLPPDVCSTGQTGDEYVRLMQENAEKCYEVARKHLRVAAERRKAAYDIRVKKSDFAVGDWVWYWYPRRYRAKSPKWQKCFTGPYLVVRVIEPVNYVLQKSPRSKPFVVHADKLKKSYGETTPSWLHVESSTDNGQVPVDSTDRRDRGQERRPLEPSVETDRIGDAGVSAGGRDAARLQSSSGQSAYDDDIKRSTVTYGLRQ